MEYFEEINNAGCGFLTKLEEPKANSLLIQIATSKVSTIEEDVLISGKSFGPARKIFTDDTCEQYEVFFNNYVSYHILNETYIGNDDTDEFIGKCFRKYKKSRYLDYINNNTGVFTYGDEQLKHYAILFYDHLVDVITTEEPIVTRIN